MPHLFDTLTIRGVTLRNRIGVSPMCQYSSDNGRAGDWHLVHLGARAAGGAALVIAEATAVEPRGRITPGCAGLWSDEHVEPLRRVTRFVSAQGAVPGIQLAHAGRKASCARPWEGGHHLADEEGGWTPVAPSAIAFGGKQPRVPRELTAAEIEALPRLFVAAARRAEAAGFEWLELHAAHGYLLHSFHSPISNRREDAYGGSFENRTRLTIAIARELRGAWPERKVLSVRLSCTDWMEGGWTLEESVELARRLKAEGVDVIDCSSGGIHPDARIPVGAGYQVPLAERIRREAGIATAAVGMITQPMQADEIVRNGRADLVLLARELLRNPNWPMDAARALGHRERLRWPRPYEFAIGG